MFGCPNVIHPLIPPSNSSINSTHLDPKPLSPNSTFPPSSSPPLSSFTPPSLPLPCLSPRVIPSCLSHTRFFPRPLWHTAPCQPRASPLPLRVIPSPSLEFPFISRIYVWNPRSSVATSLRRLCTFTQCNSPLACGTWWLPLLLTVCQSLVVGPIPSCIALSPSHSSLSVLNQPSCHASLCTMFVWPSLTATSCDDGP